MRILVVEDDPRTRAGLSEILQAEGFGVLLAADGREALQTSSTSARTSSASTS